MPVHVKGGGGAGFPPGWKENFKGVVHEQAIAKGDPVVTGVYSDIMNGMDVRLMPALAGGTYSRIAVSNDGKMFIKGCNYIDGTNSAFLWKFNDQTLVYESIAIGIKGAAYAIGAAAFSHDDRYFACVTGSKGSTSLLVYLEVFKIDGQTVTKVGEQQLIDSGAAFLRSEYAKVEFFNYVEGQYRILAYYDLMYAQVKSYSLNNDALTLLQNIGDIAYFTFIKRDETSIILDSGVTNYSNRIISVVNDIWQTADYLNAPFIYSKTSSRSICAISDDKQYAIERYVSSTCVISIYKDANGINDWVKLANPDVIPATSVFLIAAEFSPCGNYLVMGFNAAPWLIIYKRVGDVFTKIANPNVMPTAMVASIKFSRDGKNLFIAQGTDPKVTSSIICYGLESGNLVAKINSFVINPLLRWFPGDRQKFGVALDSGSIGEEIRVNLIPALNNLSIT